MLMQIHLKEGAMRAHREERKISRDALSRLMGVSSSTAYRIERGDVLPSAKFIAALLRVTGKPFEDLFEVDASKEQQISA